MSGDNDDEYGVANGRQRLPDNVVPLHALHRPYSPQREDESDEDEQE